MEQDLSHIRKTEYPVDPIFRDRWSPRAMSGEPVAQEQLMTLFEAAHWAPSSYNNQPWRFLYAMRDSEGWPLFLGLLVEFNQGWAQHAGALVVIISKKTFDNGQPSITHCLDTGAAWQNFALQGSHMGLVVHGMQGLDYDKAKDLLAVPDEYEVMAMAAVGKPGRKEDLPETLQQREEPSTRKPLAEIVCEGKFKR